jgi:hypothetical protein
MNDDMLSNHKIRTRSAELIERVDTLPRGISLFLDVPESRSCESAGVER